MSRSQYPRRYRGSRTYRPRSIARDRALRHIAAAARLSNELGGLDEQVKAYFFDLPPNELRALLDQYENIHGAPAREYAEKTVPRWRSRRVHMSGEVAERLFSLLPPRMPLDIKYQLVEGLWYHFGPRSRHRIRIGLDAQPSQVVELAASTISQFTIDYKISEDLEARFAWLSAGDVSTKQMLLSHVLEIEKSLVLDAVRQQVPVMLEHLRLAGRDTKRLSQLVLVGKHELELVMDARATGVKVETGDRLSPLTSSTRQGDTAKVVVWLVLIAIAIFFFVIAGTIDDNKRRSSIPRLPVKAQSHLSHSRSTSSRNYFD
jgi:hypothetical protein